MSLMAEAGGGGGQGRVVSVEAGNLDRITSSAILTARIETSKQRCNLLIPLILYVTLGHPQ
jgi:hypothetical protein